MDVVLDVVEESSVDQPGERSSNVLWESNCYQTSQRIASELISPTTTRRCGCGSGVPCYWSSSPSENPSKVEFLRFKLCFFGAVIFGIGLTPYQASFQSQAPVYAPRYVRLRFVSVEGQVYYESTDSFAVRAEFREQHLMLSRPALFLGGSVVVEFLGMQTRQPIPEMNSYYLCISRLRLHGCMLPGLLTPPRLRRGDDGTLEVGGLLYEKGAPRMWSSAFEYYWQRAEDSVDLPLASMGLGAFAYL